MVQEQKQYLGEDRFNYEVIDAQSIPYGNATFDAVIANHMMYHVPDRAKAIAEVRRVLKPDGKFFAATNGVKHLGEMNALVSRFDPVTPYWEGFSAMESFTLENGGDQLKSHFSEVTILRYDDALIVPEADVIVAYMLSGPAKSLVSAEKAADLKRFVEQELAANGPLRITKDSGLFKAKGV
jgi:SAM-dependent methyltransferase